MIKKVSLAEKLGSFSDHWSPKVVGDIGDYQVKLAKFQGEFVWHSHEKEDELFLVLAGSFTMELRDQKIDIHEGEFVIIPHGVDHRPVADKEVSVLLFEPGTTVNTGEASSQYTVMEPERI